MHCKVQFISPLSHTLISCINERGVFLYDIHEETCTQVYIDIRKRFSDKEFHFHCESLLEMNRHLNCYNKSNFNAYLPTCLYSRHCIYDSFKTTKHHISIFFLTQLQK